MHVSMRLVCIAFGFLPWGHFFWFSVDMGGRRTSRHASRRQHLLEITNLPADCDPLGYYSGSATSGPYLGTALNLQIHVAPSPRPTRSVVSETVHLGPHAVMRLISHAAPPKRFGPFRPSTSNRTFEDNAKL